MIVNEKQKPKADHDIATNNQTKIQAIVALFLDTERQTVGSFDCEILAAREEHLRERKHLKGAPAEGWLSSARRCSNEASLHRARSGSRRRGRSQGGASRAQKLSSARSASTRRRARLRRRRGSTRQRTGRPLEESTQQRKQRRAGRAANGAGPHRSQGQPDVK